MRNRKLAVLAICLAMGCVSADAQAVLGMDAPGLFEKGMNALEGSNASRSPANAIDYFRRSSDLGFAPAQVVLGYLYEPGHSITTDPREALELYKKAARQDDSLAQWLAGRMIYLGSVPPRDLNEAATWLEKSSGHGNPFAEYLLAKIALERNQYARSADLFRQGALQGLPQAQRQLGVLLREGQGVPMDKFEAYVWMLVSADGGLRDNLTDLQSLEADLGSMQLERAKSKARELEGSTTRSAVAHGCTGWRGEFDAIPAPPPPDLQRFCR